MLPNAICHAGLGRCPDSQGPPRVHQRSLGAVPAPERAVPKPSIRQLLKPDAGQLLGFRGELEQVGSGLWGRRNVGRCRSLEKGRL